MVTVVFVVARLSTMIAVAASDEGERTDILLRDPKWSGAPQQHRRAVPAAWLRRYRKYSAEQGSSTRSQ